MSLSTVAKSLPGADLITWLGPLGRGGKCLLLSISSLLRPRFVYDDVRPLCRWMGLESFHLVGLAAVLVGIALTMQCITELERYQAQDLAGAVISVGLLREMGPLSVSLAWCARVTALVADQAQTYTLQNPGASDSDFAASFAAPRYIAALVMGLPLSAFGLGIGFITGALVTPLLTMSTTQQFLESSREMIKDKDLVVYFLKTLLVNPTIAVFAGCAAGRLAQGRAPENPTPGQGTFSVAARAVTGMFLFAFTANLVVTLVAYLK
jgi:phospholipid/cholesterol/gamma-HCH transport system permease protein